MSKNYIVISPFADLLLKPSQTSELADQALYGMKLNIVERQDDWCLVEMEYKYKGWMHRSDISKKSPTDWMDKCNAYVQSPFAEIMPEASYRGRPLLNIPKGSRLFLMEDDCDIQGWCKVQLHDGRQGHCRSEWIRPYKSLPNPKDESALRQRLVSDALSYMGTHYKWGGKSPAGIDCSGLTFMAYWINGISIYRDAVIQPDYLVHEISEATAKPGDLLYFPGHIALYLGKGQYVHSTGSQGGVVQNSLIEGSNNFHESLRKDLYAWGSIF
ncbi:NlpC/P60 family protein [Fusibacter sp. JL216-2]|uniref:C40 family peptidase n=1 Tax=Fusibacter sp. JL216-2 TaxID=3071453 RepID=UPI003D34655F